MSRKVNYSKIFILTSLAVYLSLNVIVELYENDIKVELEHCDLDKSGFLEADELTAGCQKLMDKSIRDTARNFAPYTLIPISMLIGGCVVLVGKLVNLSSRSKAAN